MKLINSLTSGFLIAGLLIVILLLPSLVNAGEPHDFISAVINSFKTSDIAGDRIENSKADSLFMQMKDIMVFNAEIEMARKYINPYLKSNNDLIMENANYYDSIYMSVIENNKLFLSQIEDLLNNPDELYSKQETFLKELSKHLATNEQFWRYLFRVTTLSTYTLIDQSRTKNGKIAFLTINNQERINLIDQLEGAFGDKVKKGLKAGQFSIKGSASILWHVLTAKWISSDNNEPPILFTGQISSVYTP